jgi:hypothetical protein
LFIRVAEDDHLAVTGWPEDVTVEVTKKSSDKLCIPRGIRDETFLIQNEERSTTGAFPEGPPAQTPVSMGGARRPLAGTPAVMVNLRVLVVESEHYSMVNFPL